MLTPIIWSIEEFHWSDGSKYTSEFHNNNIHGKGVFEWVQRIKFNGDCENNKIHGA